METITLNIGGMSSQGCVGSVTRVLKALPGVANVAVKLDPGSAEITFDPSRTDLASMRAAIEDAGYDVAA